MRLEGFAKNSINSLAAQNAVSLVANVPEVSTLIRNSRRQSALAKSSHPEIQTSTLQHDVPRAHRGVVQVGSIHILQPS